MKNTMKTTILVAAIAAVLLFAVVGQLARADTHDTLKGISEVYVLVESFNENAERARFNEQTFQTDVELKLRLAGIKVQTRKELFATPGSPYLYLIVNPLHEQRGENAAFSISLELVEEAWLVRNPAMLVSSATTWSGGSVGYGDLQYARDSVKDVVDQFINAWLSVNPQ